jgi:hypothetical protein
MNTDDNNRNDDHGAIFGIDLLASREISMDVDYLGDNHPDVMVAYRTMARVMRPLAVTYPFAFQRPGEVKKQLWVRPRKRAFPSNGEVALGLSKGSLVWDAPDPRIYSLAAKTATITLTSGQTSGSAVLTNAGDFRGWPTFLLSGAGSNPRITVSAQTADPLDGTVFNNSTVGLDLAMAVSDVLSINAQTKDIKLNGVNAYNVKRNDNVWWQYMPGTQTVTFTRPSSATTQTLTITYFDVWL